MTRILIDAQYSQTGSRTRGIGHWAAGFLDALLRHPAQPECHFLCSDRVPGTIEPLRARWQGRVSEDQFHVVHLPSGIAGLQRPSPAFFHAATLLLEQAVQEVEPDVVLVLSPFEGWGDEVVPALGFGRDGPPVGAVCYDLIPLARKAAGFIPESDFSSWYEARLAAFERAERVLAISETTRSEVLTRLHLPADRVVTIGTGVDERFSPGPADPGVLASLKARYGIRPPFLLVPIGSPGDPHKNLLGCCEAFGRLPESLRAGLQLVVTGPVDQTTAARARETLRLAGADPTQLCLPGLLLERELLVAYRAASLVVIPTLGEGFGLPLAAALATGAPVVASRIPAHEEVAGALGSWFDPRDPDEMARAMARFLTNQDERHQQAACGPALVKDWRWELVADRAVQALSAIAAPRSSRKSPGKGEGGTRDRGLFTEPLQPSRSSDKSGSGRPRLALVTPYPPEASGIADYAAELAPALATHYDVEVVSRVRQTGSFPRVSPQEFLAEFERYDRVLYQVGNSPFHAWQVDLAVRVPGVVVLHDVVLDDLWRFFEREHQATDTLLRARYDGGGWPALLASKGIGPLAECQVATPGAFLDGALALVVHSEHAREILRATGCLRPTLACEVIPLLHGLAPQSPEIRAKARAALGLAPDELLLASFGRNNPMKLTDRLLASCGALPAFLKPRVRLALVGELPRDDYGARLLRTIEDLRASGWNVEATDRISPEHYTRYLQAADLAVQLLSNSRGETSRAVLDCVAHGIPVVADRHGAMGEVPEGVVHLLEETFSIEELADVVARLLLDPDARAGMAHKARGHVAATADPARVGERYRAVLEEAWAKAWPSHPIRIIVEVAGVAAREDGLRANESRSLARALALSPRAAPSPRLLLEVTATAERDVGTGIQRVTRALTRFLIAPDQGQTRAPWRVEPVRFAGKELFFARAFTHRLFGLGGEPLRDAPVDAYPGDVFFVLDCSPDRVAANSSLLETLRDQGTRRGFFIHDMLPLQHPKWFSASLVHTTANWLTTVARLASEVVCCSRTVAEEFATWCDRRFPQRTRPLRVGWNHSGADFWSSPPPVTLLRHDGGHGYDDVGARKVLARIPSEVPVVLMVGTLEPRKGYEQTLEAFELLWSRRVDVVLLIVGQEGWHVDGLVRRMQDHPQAGKRLMWLRYPSDTLLGACYERANVLLAASEAEGFGLPIVEAARYGTPVIARDIPIFRETTGGNATFFSGEDPGTLADVLEAWLGNHASQRANALLPPSRTWAESACTLAAMLEDPSHPQWLTA